VSAELPQFSLVAGEASGDLLAGLLLDGMQQRWPHMQASGIGGARMLERGFKAWWSSDKLSVFGYVDALRHYREILGIRNQLKTKLLANPPDVFIGVDAPDFNLDLEADLRHCQCVQHLTARFLPKLARAMIFEAQNQSHLHQ